MICLAIESSCDETAVAIVKNGREVLTNIISTQIEIHKRFGGVVPEIASREHIQNISYIVDEALEAAKLNLNNIDFIACTYGPGLVGALLVGMSYAKALAYALEIPLVPINHIEGHIAANYITYNELEPPFLALVVSGGHSHLVHVKDYTKFEILGKTRDDAVGEAFDKVARVLGLGYPGGPEINKLAESGSATYKLTKTKFENLDFSFSGIKTAVINIAHKEGDNLRKADMCASFEQTVCEELISNTQIAMEQSNLKKVVLAGGVSANTRLRKMIHEMAKNNGYECYVPNFEYCTDNAAMIGAAGYYNYLDGNIAGLELNSIANLKIGEKRF